MVYLILGICIGLLSEYFLLRKYSDGCIVIDDTDPNKTLYRLEINELDNIDKQKRIILKVKDISK